MANNGRRPADNVSGLTWIEGVLSALGSTRSPGRNGKWQCPVHARTGEHAPSLAVGVRDEGGLWLHCFAGCPTREIAHAMGLTLDQLRTPPRLSPARWITCRGLATGFPAPKATGSPRSRGFRFETIHSYGPEFRLERWRHPASGDKAMEWWARNPKGEWVPGLLGTPERDLPLYRETELVAAVALGETVLLVESESSVDALNHDGWYAGTWAGGADAPPLERIAALLTDHPQVVIIGDADEAGRRCAAKLATALPLAAVLVSERDGEDARDLHTRLGPQRFAELIGAAPFPRAAVPA